MIFISPHHAMNWLFENESSGHLTAIVKLNLTVSKSYHQGNHL